MPAHPRSRGENEAHCLVPSGVYGSSPLTRGKRLDHEPLIPTARLIPAHAGKTRRSGCPPLLRAAHPRSRGENLLDLSTGTRDRRLIPAHAGKTLSRRSRRTSCPAHPRSRGENADSMAEKLGLSGSSPLTRGKLESAAKAGLDLRLIPAHAGKTTRWAWTNTPRQAHPSSRGENFRVVGHRGGDRGSSPLTRGKPTVPEATHANSGSSPLTRGKRCGNHRWELRWRLIPAHAGKTR